MVCWNRSVSWIDQSFEKNRTHDNIARNNDVKIKAFLYQNLVGEFKNLTLPFYVNLYNIIIRFLDTRNLDLDTKNVSLNTRSENIC